MLLGEAKALIIQLFIRGRYENGDPTHLQAEGLIARINQVIR